MKLVSKFWKFDLQVSELGSNILLVTLTLVKILVLIVNFTTFVEYINDVENYTLSLMENKTKMFFKNLAMLRNC